MWRRLLLALVVFVPWLYVGVQPIGPHVPGFLMVNALRVGSIVTGLAEHCWRWPQPRSGVE